MGCKIVQVGKRRDGGYRYWCVAHRANATAKYGVAAQNCVAANDIPIPPEASRDLDIANYKGGVALWGSVPSVYDTTLRPIDRGIHVHARNAIGGQKVIDQTYRKLRIPFRGDLLSDSWLVVDEIDAINYMVSGVLGFSTIPVSCGHCGFAHLDRDWFAVHAHRRHQCHGCGRQFSDTVVGIGNPLSMLSKAIEEYPRRRGAAPRTIEIRQRNYPGGIQIWGSNPAILWTSETPEEVGIHLHCYVEDSQEVPDLDDTYSKVTIDGIDLDVAQVRTYMAQSAMPHLEGRIVSLNCPHCSASHFDVGGLAYTPHIQHDCEVCGKQFQAPSQMKKTISNPFVAARLALARMSPNVLRNDRLGLRPEAI